MLTHSTPFSTSHAPEFFLQFPAAPAVFVLRGREAEAEPYVSKTSNLRRRLQRLLAPSEAQSKRINLRTVVATIEYSPTGSDFESSLLLYRALRERFPESYHKRLRLRPASLVRFNLENQYPRAYVTTRIGRLAGPSLYYGPFRSHAVAEKFLNDSLDLFKIRRCTFNLNPDPAFPGCVYSEMKMCLAPCFRGCTDEAYTAEVERVRQYFDTRGQSILGELERERERLSTALDFESAAAQHAKVGKIKAVLASCDEICGRLDRLDAVVVQPAPETECVRLFRFYRGDLAGPANLQLDQAEPRQLEEAVRSALDGLAGGRVVSGRRFAEALSLLKRWYYRSHKTGEIFFAGDQGDPPVRRIARAAERMAGGGRKQVRQAPKETTAEETPAP